MSWAAAQTLARHARAESPGMGRVAEPTADPAELHGLTLASHALRVAGAHGLPMASLYESSRTEEGTLLRAAFAAAAITAGVPVRHVAAWLKRSPGAVNYLLRRHGGGCR